MNRKIHAHTNDSYFARKRIADERERARKQALRVRDGKQTPGDIERLEAAARKRARKPGMHL